VELQKALETVDIKLPGHEVRELIRKHDTNVKDGRLDMVEFSEVSCHFCCNYLRQQGGYVIVLSVCLCVCDS